MAVGVVPIGWLNPSRKCSQSTGCKNYRLPAHWIRALLFNGGRRSRIYLSIVSCSTILRQMMLLAFSRTHNKHFELLLRTTMSSTISASATICLG